KGLAEGGGQFAALPGAVRNNEIEQPTFFAWVLFLEQSLRIPRKFEQSHAFLKVGLIGRLMPLDFAQATMLFGAPLGGHAIEKCAVHLAVELVYVHGMHAALEPVVFGPQPTDSRLLLALLVGMAGAERVAHPIENFLVECQPAQHVRELPLDNLLANV